MTQEEGLRLRSSSTNGVICSTMHTLASLEWHEIRKYKRTHAPALTLLNLPNSKLIGKSSIPQSYRETRLNLRIGITNTLSQVTGTR